MLLPKIKLYSHQAPALAHFWLGPEFSEFLDATVDTFDVNGTVKSNVFFSSFDGREWKLTLSVNTPLQTARQIYGIGTTTLSLQLWKCWYVVWNSWVYWNCVCHLHGIYASSVIVNVVQRQGAVFQKETLWINKTQFPSDDESIYSVVSQVVNNECRWSCLIWTVML